MTVAGPAVGRPDERDDIAVSRCWGDALDGPGLRCGRPVSVADGDLGLSADHRELFIERGRA